MHSRGTPSYDEAHKTALANKSPRTLFLEELERWVEGTQYDGLPSWYDDSKPRFQRAPCIVYPIVKNASASFVDLVLGQGRWPKFVAAVDEVEGASKKSDDAQSGDGETDDETSSEVADAITEAHRQSRFQAVAKECLAQAMACRTAVAIFGVRKGKLFVDTAKAAWCTPKLDVDGTVLSLEIRYPYIEESKAADGSWEAKTKLYRRVIDERKDTTFLPADADENGVEPDWKVDKARTREHDLGFCPVVWYPFVKGCAVVSKIDGTAIHENLLDEIQALDFALSSRHTAAIYASDPQWTEVGVHAGHNPSAPGRPGGIPSTPKGGRPDGGNMVTGHYTDGGPGQGSPRRKGAGVVWQYPNKDTKVDLHVLPGDALKAIDEHIRDLRTKISESLAAVFMDPESIRYAAALSAKALEVLRERQLNRCDQIRDDFGDKFLIPATLMLMRVLRAIGAKSALKFPRLAEVVKSTATLDEADLTLHWPSYFKPDLEDEKKESDIVRDDLDAGIITTRVAVERRAARYGIDDVEAHLEALAEERQAKEERLSHALHALTPNDDDDPDDDEDDDLEDEAA